MKTNFHFQPGHQAESGHRALSTMERGQLRSGQKGATAWPAPARLSLGRPTRQDHTLSGRQNTRTTRHGRMEHSVRCDRRGATGARPVGTSSWWACPSRCTYAWQHKLLQLVLYRDASGGGGSTAVKRCSGKTTTARGSMTWLGRPASYGEH
jgi:hypothetical protein